MTSTAAQQRRVGHVLAERLSQVEIYGDTCACGNAEARAFLAKPRRMLDTIERGEVG